MALLLLLLQRGVLPPGWSGCYCCTAAYEGEGVGVVEVGVAGVQTCCCHQQCDMGCRRQGQRRLLWHGQPCSRRRHMIAL